MEDKVAVSIERCKLAYKIIYESLDLLEKRISVSIELNKLSYKTICATLDLLEDFENKYDDVKVLLKLGTPEADEALNILIPKTLKRLTSLHDYLKRGIDSVERYLSSIEVCEDSFIDIKMALARAYQVLSGIKFIIIDIRLFKHGNGCVGFVITDFKYLLAEHGTYAALEGITEANEENS